MKSTNTTTLHSDLELLQELLPGSIEHLEDVSILTLSEKVGKGEIRYHNLQEGLRSYDFDITLKQDTEIPIDCIAKATLQFLYCLEGTFQHQFDIYEESTPIEQYQTAVAHSNTGLSSKIFITRGKRLILNIILVDKENYFKKFNEEPSDFGQQLKNVLGEISEQPTYFHAGGYSLKIAEQLRLLIGLEHDNDVSEKLSQKGRYFIILAKQIEQFYQEINNSTNTSGLLKSELQKVNELGKLIRETPEFPHSIRSLCGQSSLSPAKLQEGFKYIFERTVADYVRSVRLDKAVQLLKTSDLTISEIVYSVGLTSRSYFCKIFKKQYNCSPKEFKKKMNA